MASVTNQDLALQFAQQKEYRQNLLYVVETDCFYLFNEVDGYYQLLDEFTLGEMVFRFVTDATTKNITKGTVKDVMQLLRWVAYKKIPQLDGNYIALKDTALNLTTFTFEEKTRDVLAFHYVPFTQKEVEQAETPERWYTFLDEVIVTEQDHSVPDIELQTVLQEMFGFYLLNNMYGATVFFLYGDGGNGKSVLLDILIKLIGEDYVSSSSIQSLTTKDFILPTIIGKKLNLCNDEESKYVKSDKFKALVTGDYVETRRLYSEPIKFRPKTKYIFSTNNMPTFDSLNNGLRRRINIIPFHRIFEDHEQDKQLVGKLFLELPGILKWAIEGAKRFSSQGHRFTTSQQIESTKKEFENTISSAIAFFRDTYVIDDSSFESVTDMYQNYRVWCESTGKKAMSQPNFFKEIKGIYPHLKSKLGWSDTMKRMERGRLVRRRREEEITND